MKISQEVEAPSRLQPPFFMIGQDSRGHWVVRDQNGVRGGLFVNRAEALRYIRSETGSQPYPTVMVAGTFELDIAAGRMMPPPRASGTEARHALRVA
jgi:hypothetical protein